MFLSDREILSRNKTSEGIPLWNPDGQNDIKIRYEYNEKVI